MRLRLNEVEAPRISRQSAYGGVKVVSSTRRPTLHPGDTCYLCRLLNEPQGKGMSTDGIDHLDISKNPTRDTSPEPPI